MKITEYLFPANLVDINYCVFPDALENNDLVLFHATPIQNYEAIKNLGFKSAAVLGTGILQSVSFAKRSSMALNHAISLRTEQPRAYCIFAVCYETINRPGIKNCICDIHDYTLDPPPVIIGYVTVPEKYKHR